MRSWCYALAVTAMASCSAWAGPPYISDDPEPTDYRHFEIYAFSLGTTNRDGTGGQAGIDFNYGATPDVQLTAVLPLGYDDPTAGRSTVSLSNVELAAKYRFLHQDNVGWDVSIFPRVFLPSGSAAVGERHASFFLPVWLEKDWGRWSTFGGGGYVFNRGGGSQDYWIMGWVLARQVLPDLQVGVELYHLTADSKDGQATTGLGAGLKYDMAENYHLLTYFGPGIQNAAATNRCSWYSAILFTF